MPKYYDLEPYEQYTIPQQYSDEYSRGYCKAIQRIMADPPLDLEEVMNGAWIPVGERLPSEDGGYLATFDSNYAKDLGIDLIGIAPYDADGESFGEWFEGNFYDIPVTAWMPLPKPYKEEQDG